MQYFTINVTSLRHVVSFHMLYVCFIYVSFTINGSTLHVSINPSQSRQSECTDGSLINNIAYRFEGCEQFPDGSGIFLIPTRYKNGSLIR